MTFAASSLMEQLSWSVFVEAEVKPPQVPLTAHMPFTTTSLTHAAHRATSKQPVEMSVPAKFEPMGRRAPSKQPIEMPVPDELQGVVHRGQSKQPIEILGVHEFGGVLRRVQSKQPTEMPSPEELGPVAHWKPSRQPIGMPVGEEFEPVLLCGQSKQTAEMSVLGTFDPVRHRGQSKQSTDRPVPDELESQLKLPILGKTSSATRSDSTGTDSAETLHAASGSRSSVTTAIDNWDFNERPCPLTVCGTPPKALNGPFCPALITPVISGGSRFKQGLCAHLPMSSNVPSCKDAPREANIAQTKGVGLKRSLRARIRTSWRALFRTEASKEASKETSVPMTVGARVKKNLQARCDRKDSWTSIAVDDTTDVPADIMFSLLQAANAKRGRGQHRLATYPKPRLVLNDSKEEECDGWKWY